jgi:hypothetical protein
MIRHRKFKTFLFLILSITLLSACKRIYAPSEHIPISMDVVGPIDVRNVISIVNDQTKSNLVLVHSTGYANLQKWTDFIVDQLKAELENRGIQIKPNSDIVFKVSVQDAKLYSGTFAGRCILKVLVERHDIAWSKTYEGNCARLQTSIDCAIYRAVEAILGDRGFQKALSREYQEKVEEEAVSEEDVVEKLKQLKEMRDQGLITEEEYQNKKKEILGEF